MTNANKNPRAPERTGTSAKQTAGGEGGKPKDLHLGAMFFAGDVPAGTVERLEADGLHVAVRAAESISPADVCESLGDADGVSAVYVNVQRGADDQEKFERAVAALSPVAASTFDYAISGRKGVAHGRVDVLPLDPAALAAARADAGEGAGGKGTAPWEDADGDGGDAGGSPSETAEEAPQAPAQDTPATVEDDGPVEEGAVRRPAGDGAPADMVADSDGSRLTMRQEAAVLEIDPADLTDSVLPPFAPTNVVSVLEDMVSTDFLRPPRKVLIGVSPAVALGDPDDESPDEVEDDFWDERNNDAIIEYTESSSDLGGQYANDRAIVRDLTDEEFERTAEQVASIVRATQSRRLGRIEDSRTDMADHMDEVNRRVEQDRADYLDGLKEAMAKAAVVAGQAYADEHKARTMRDCDEYMAEHAQLIARGLERQSLEDYTTLVGAERACDDPDDIARILGTTDFDARSIRAYFSVLRFRAMNDRSLARLVDTLTDGFESTYIAGDDADGYLPSAVDADYYRGPDPDPEPEPEPDPEPEPNPDPEPETAAADGVADEPPYPLPVEIYGAGVEEPAVDADDEGIEESLADETTSIDLPGSPGDGDGADDGAADGVAAVTAPVADDIDDLGDLDEFDGFDDLDEADGDADDGDEDGSGDADDGGNPYGSEEPKRKRRMKLPVKIACGIGAAAVVAGLGIGAARAGLLAPLGIPGADTQQVQTQQDDPQGTYRAGDQYRVNITGSDGQPQETTVTIDGFEPDGTVHTKDADGNSYTISRDKMDAIASSEGNKDAGKDAGDGGEDAGKDAAKDEGKGDDQKAAPDAAAQDDKSQGADGSAAAPAGDAAAGAGSATAQAQAAVDGNGAA